MLQGFYYLALRQRRIRRAMLAAALFTAVGSMTLAVYFSRAPQAEAATPVAGFIATVDDGGHLIVRQQDGDAPYLQTAIDTRTLPAGEQDKLQQGIPLADADALSRLLENYGS